MSLAKRLFPLFGGCALLIVACSLARADETAPLDATGPHNDAVPTAAARAAEPSDALSSSRRGNICFGGLEDGKLIPNDDRIDNPFKQTTLLGCSVEGGEPTYLPDLKPAIPNGVLS